MNFLASDLQKVIKYALHFTHANNAHVSSMALFLNIIDQILKL